MTQPEPARAASTLYQFGLLTESQLQKAYDRFVVIAKSGPQFDSAETLLRIALRGYTEAGKFPQDLYNAAIVSGADLMNILAVWEVRKANEL